RALAQSPHRLRGRQLRRAFGRDVGRASRCHTGDLAQITQLAKEEGQWGFWKNPHEVAGPDEEITYPKRTRRFAYEGEVAIVSGKRGKDILANQIAEYVRGRNLIP